MSSILPCPPCLAGGGVWQGEGVQQLRVVQWGSRGGGGPVGEGVGGRGGGWRRVDGGLGEGEGAGDISSTLPYILHYHIVPRPKGLRTMRHQLTDRGQSQPYEVSGDVDLRVENPNVVCHTHHWPYHGWAMMFLGQYLPLASEGCSIWVCSKLPA